MYGLFAAYKTQTLTCILLVSSCSICSLLVQFNLHSLLSLHALFFNARTSFMRNNTQTARNWNAVGKIKTKTSLIRILECWVWITTVIKDILLELMRFCEDGYEPSSSIPCMETCAICAALGSNWRLLETAQLLQLSSSASGAALWVVTLRIWWRWQSDFLKDFVSITETKRSRLCNILIICDS